MQHVSAVLEWKTGDPFLAPLAGSQTEESSLDQSYLLHCNCVFLQRSVLRKQRKVESKREVEELAGGGDVKSLS